MADSERWKIVAKPARRGREPMSDSRATIILIAAAVLCVALMGGFLWLYAHRPIHSVADRIPGHISCQNLGHGALWCERQHAK